MIRPCPMSPNITPNKNGKVMIVKIAEMEIVSKIWVYKMCRLNNH